MTSLVAQRVKPLPAMREAWVRSLDWEDPLEKEMATPVLLPGKSHGQRCLAGYSPWGPKEDMTEQLNFTFQKHEIAVIIFALNVYSKFLKSSFVGNTVPMEI